ncbi:MAG: dockerin type I domain-containing protein [Lentimicrobiaceae bacterium]|nr:dockerin type I domain-containing protein [Lentimicrobiaceae bacterium]
MKQNLRLLNTAFFFICSFLLHAQDASRVDSANRNKKDEICANTLVTFKASIENGGDAPAYQWQLNGVDITGANDSMYTYIPKEGDILTCQLTNNDYCVEQNVVISNEILLHISQCGVMVRGTIFPFVHHAEPEYANLFFTIARLYDAELLLKDVEAALATAPLYADTAIYYDGLVFIPRTPKYPGYLSKLDNPGCSQINWAALGYNAETMDTTYLLEGEKPQMNIGHYAFKDVKQGNYILVLSSGSYATRFVCITVNDEDIWIPYKELIPGDVNGDFIIDQSDIQLMIEKISQYGDEPYDPHYDLNGDLIINMADISLLKALLQFSIDLYKDTNDCLYLFPPK